MFIVVKNDWGYEVTDTTFSSGWNTLSHDEAKVMRDRANALCNTHGWSEEMRELALQKAEEEAIERQVAKGEEPDGFHW